MKEFPRWYLIELLFISFVSTNKCTGICYSGFQSRDEISPAQEFSVCGYDFNEQLIKLPEKKLVPMFTITFFFYLLLVILRILIYGIKHIYVVIYSIEG